MFNFNVGILGHVDSGKTSLAKALSQVASTAAFDKNPQSQDRGITLDLGFSSFSILTPSHLKSDLENVEKIQITLIDCPGHASLIRTVIGGTQIIDLVLLVIDITKGIQIQTLECLILAEVCCKSIIVVLNKLDLIEESKRHLLVEKLKKKIVRSFATFNFLNVPIVSISANPCKEQETVGLSDLISQISLSVFIPKRDTASPFLFAVDHCFAIKGKGTVLTGTILQGSIKLDEIVEIPSLCLKRKVKQIQMFKQSVKHGAAGDRMGLCLPNFDHKQMERGIVCAPGVAKQLYCCVITVKKVKHFKFKIDSKCKFHITIGYNTTVSSITCFKNQKFTETENFEMGDDYEYCESLSSDETIEYNSYLLIEFEKPVLTYEGVLVIGSKLDITGNDCRLAFSGKLLTFSTQQNYKDEFLSKIKIFKRKTKTGHVERLIDKNTVIVKGLFKKEANIGLFTSLNVTLSTGEIAIIDGAFGKSGKVKVIVKNGLRTETIDMLNRKIRDLCDTIVVTLSFKKYIFSSNKRIIQ